MWWLFAISAAAVFLLYLVSLRQTSRQRMAEGETADFRQKQTITGVLLAFFLLFAGLMVYDLVDSSGDSGEDAVSQQESLEAPLLPRLGLGAAEEQSSDDRRDSRDSRKSQSKPRSRANSTSSTSVSQVQSGGAAYRPSTSTGGHVYRAQTRPRGSNPQARVVAPKPRAKPRPRATPKTAVPQAQNQGASGQSQTQCWEQYCQTQDQSPSGQSQCQAGQCQGQGAGDSSTAPPPGNSGKYCLDGNGDPKPCG